MVGGAILFFLVVVLVTSYRRRRVPSISSGPRKGRLVFSLSSRSTLRNYVCIGLGRRPARRIRVEDVNGAMEAKVGILSQTTSSLGVREVRHAFPCTNGFRRHAHGRKLRL